MAKDQAPEGRKILSSRVAGLDRPGRLGFPSAEALGYVEMETLKFVARRGGHHRKPKGGPNRFAWAGRSALSSPHEDIPPEIYYDHNASRERRGAGTIAVCVDATGAAD